MANIQAITLLMQYMGENVALFCGGLFAGATLYICLTERPPRTALGFADLLALSRANAGRTNILLGILSTVTALAALLASFTGAGAAWLAGGVGHLVTAALLVTRMPQIAGELFELDGEPASESRVTALLAKQTAYFSALCLIGLIALYLFIVQPGSPVPTLTPAEHAMTVLQLEPVPLPAPHGFALWNLGFRPFFLFAGAFASLSVACWTLEFAGWLGTHAWLRNPLWHAHEMIFGYVFAVAVGFLFTAGRTWSQQPTPSGAALAAIVAAWAAARIFVLLDLALPAALADSAFALAAALGLGRALMAGANRRNYFFVALLAGMGCANLAFHLAMAGWIDLPVRFGLQIGLDLILFMIAVMGGRVIPMFTNGGVPGTGAARQPWLERVSLGSVLAVLAADLAGAPEPAVGVLCALACVAHAARFALWRPLSTFRVPIVWILHASYAWVVVALGLRALAGFDLVAVSVATHALTVGAIGGLTLGMMTRVARGHTGRSLKTGGTETAAYLLVQAAALVRVFLPLAAPQLLLTAAFASGALWTAAFALFALTYWPILTRPRADALPG